MLRIRGRDAVTVALSLVLITAVASGCGGESTETVTETTPPPATTEEAPAEKSSVTGPAECGQTDAGATVVINSGSISCEEAIAVASESSGPNSATGPAGWDCSQFAETLEGSPVGGAEGFGCLRDDGTRISAYLGGSDPEPTAATQDCAEDPGVRAFEISVRGVSCDTAFSGIREFLEAGFAEGSTVGNGFVCGSEGPAGVEGTEWRCVKGAQAFRFSTGG